MLSMKIIILIIMSLLTCFSNTYAGSVKEDYELQERCAKSAAAAFNKYYGKEDLLTHYANHYNKKLNKCFVLITSTSLPKNKGDRIIHSKLLFDVNENKEYGSFIMLTDTHEVMECTILGNPVSSKAEWDALVKPYMEE